MYALADPAQALALVDATMRRDLPGTLAIMMNDDGLPGTCIAVEGGGHPDAIFDVVECVAQVCRRTPCIAALVFASIRPDAPPQNSDIDRWFELLETFDQLDTAVLEWFIVSPESVLGMRDATGCEPLWSRRGCTRRG